MTFEELETLPINGGVRQIVTLEPDGSRRVHYEGSLCRVLNFKPDDPVVIEGRYATLWSVGWAGGVRYRQRLG